MTPNSLLSLIAAGGATYGGCCRTPAPIAAMQKRAPASSTSISFSFANRPVKVGLVEPDAIHRGLVEGCKGSQTWRPELVLPTLAFVAESVVRSPDRVVMVSLEHDDLDANPLGIALDHGEYAVGLNANVLALYDRDGARYYCLDVSEVSDVTIRLDLFKVRERLSPVVTRQPAVRNASERPRVRQMSADRRLRATRAVPARRS